MSKYLDEILGHKLISRYFRYLDMKYFSLKDYNNKARFVMQDVFGTQFILEWKFGSRKEDRKGKSLKLGSFYQSLIFDVAN